jgi:hypothetical protein
MERRYRAQLVVKGFEYHGTCFSGLKVSLFRPYTGEDKENEYNFQELITNYEETDENNAAHFRNYVRFHLFTREEIKNLKIQLEISGLGILEYWEIRFPMEYLPPDSYYLDDSSEDQQPALSPPNDPPQLDFVFENLGVVGHYDLRNFRMFEPKDFKDQEEAIKWAERILCQYDLRMFQPINKVLTYDMLL